jgi:hypothetical protein
MRIDRAFTPLLTALPGILAVNPDARYAGSPR